MSTCAVCGKPGRARRGYKRILCDECAKAAQEAEGYRRNLIANSPRDSWRKTQVYKPQDGGIDTYEGRSRETLE